MAGPFTEQSEAQSLLSELMAPAFWTDPYPVYARCRDHGPIQLREANITIFSSYRDCEEVLRHPSASSDPLKSGVAQRELAAQPWRRPEGPQMLIRLDPPDHTRVRRLVSKAFVPKVISGMKHEITTLVNGLLDEFAKRGRFDAVADLAQPLPVAVFCRLFGVPLGDQPKFSQLSAVLASANDPLVPISDEHAQAIRWLGEYLDGLIAQRRAHPGDDLMSRLIAVEESGDRLTPLEIVTNTGLLLVGGHDSTTALLANAILALLRHPGQWAALGADADRAAAVIDETLRHDAPAQLVFRHATNDMTVGDTTVVKGGTIVLLLGAANRDPAVFERPDAFDPDRKMLRHLAFGGGTHHCLGASLARLEASVVLSAVTVRFPKAQLAAEPQHKKSNIVQRSLWTLPVVV